MNSEGTSYMPKYLLFLHIRKLLRLEILYKLQCRASMSAALALLIAISAPPRFPLRTGT